MEFAAIKAVVVLNPQSPTSRLQVSEDRRCIQERIGDNVEQSKIRKHYVESCIDASTELRAVYDGCNLDADVVNVIKGHSCALFCAAVKKVLLPTNDLFVLSLERLRKAIEDNGHHTVLRYAFLGVSDSRCVNLVTERGVTQLAHFTDLEPLFQEAICMSAVIDRVRKGASLPHVCIVRVDTHSSKPTRGHLCLADLGTPSFDDENITSRLSISSATLARSVHVLKSIVQQLSQVSFTGLVPYHESSLTATVSEFVGGNSRTTFLLDIESKREVPSTEVASALAFVHALRKVKNRVVQCFIDKPAIDLQQRYERLVTDHDNLKYGYDQALKRHSVRLQQLELIEKTLESECSDLRQELGDAKARFNRLSDLLAEKSDRTLSLEQHLDTLRQQYEDGILQAHEELAIIQLTHASGLIITKTNALVAQDMQRHIQIKLANVIDDGQRQQLSLMLSKQQAQHCQDVAVSTEYEKEELTYHQRLLLQQCEHSTATLTNMSKKHGVLVERITLAESKLQQRETEEQSLLDGYEQLETGNRTLTVELRDALAKQGQLLSAMEEQLVGQEKYRMQMATVMKEAENAKTMLQHAQQDIHDVGERNVSLTKDKSDLERRLAVAEQSYQDLQKTHTQLALEMLKHAQLVTTAAVQQEKRPQEKPASAAPAAIAVPTVSIAAAEGVVEKPVPRKRAKQDRRAVVIEQTKEVSPQPPTAVTETKDKIALPSTRIQHSRTAARKPKPRKPAVNTQMHVDSMTSLSPQEDPQSEGEELFGGSKIVISTVPTHTREKFDLESATGSTESDTSRVSKDLFRKKRRKLETPKSMLHVIDTPATDHAMEKMQQTLAFLQSGFQVPNLQDKLHESQLHV